MERVHKIITAMKDILFVLGIIWRILEGVQKYYKRKNLEARGYVYEGGSNYKGTTIGFTRN